MKHYVWGEIEFRKPHSVTGRYLVPDSFGTARSGQAEAAIDHWRTNNYRFDAPMTWRVTDTGLFVAHFLDDRFSVEQELIEQIKQHQLLLSHGDGAHPAATREAIAGGTGRRVTYVEEPLRRVTFEHISYVRQAAFPQQPVRYAGTVPV